MLCACFYIPCHPLKSLFHRGINSPKMTQSHGGKHLWDRQANNNTFSNHIVYPSYYCNWLTGDWMNSTDGLLFVFYFVGIIHSKLHSQLNPNTLNWSGHKLSVFMLICACMERLTKTFTVAHQLSHITESIFYTSWVHWNTQEICVGKIAQKS